MLGCGKSGGVLAAAMALMRHVAEEELTSALSVSHLGGAGLTLGVLEAAVDLWSG